MCLFYFVFLFSTSEVSSCSFLLSCHFLAFTPAERNALVFQVLLTKPNTTGTLTFF